MTGKLRNMTSIYLLKDDKVLLLFRKGGRVVSDVWTGSAGGHFEEFELNDANHHIIVCETDGKIVASCVCVIIPNLTRNVRPYAFVENVVTHGKYRKKGYATDCLNFAKKIAEENHCYKMMLLTGSKEESTLNFYRNAGYNSSDKTAFIQWIDM